MVVGFEQSVKDVLVSILVIMWEDFEKGVFCDLIDVLKEVQGVMVMGVVNEKDIFIWGLLGFYMLILVDGKCQSICDVCINGNLGFEQSFILFVVV